MKNAAIVKRSITVGENPSAKETRLKYSKIPQAKNSRHDEFAEGDKGQRGD